MLLSISVMQTRFIRAFIGALAGCLVAYGYLYFNWVWGFFGVFFGIVLISDTYGESRLKAKGFARGILFGLSFALFISYFLAPDGPLLLLVSLTGIFIALYLSKDPNITSTCVIFSVMTIVVFNFDINASQLTAYFSFQIGIAMLTGIIMQQLVSRIVYPEFARDKWQLELTRLLSGLASALREPITHNYHQQADFVSQWRQLQQTLKMAIIECSASKKKKEKLSNIHILSRELFHTVFLLGKQRTHFKNHTDHPLYTLVKEAYNTVETFLGSYKLNAAKNDNLIPQNWLDNFKKDYEACRQTLGEVFDHATLLSVQMELKHLIEMIKLCEDLHEVISGRKPTHTACMEKKRNLIWKRTSWIKEVFVSIDIKQVGYSLKTIVSILLSFAIQSFFGWQSGSAMISALLVSHPSLGRSINVIIMRFCCGLAGALYGFFCLFLIQPVMQLPLLFILLFTGLLVGGFIASFGREYSYMGWQFSFGFIYALLPDTVYTGTIGTDMFRLLGVLIGATTGLFVNLVFIPQTAKKLLETSCARTLCLLKEAYQGLTVQKESVKSILDNVFLELDKQLLLQKEVVFEDINQKGYAAHFGDCRLVLVDAYLCLKCLDKILSDDNGFKDDFVQMYLSDTVNNHEGVIEAMTEINKAEKIPVLETLLSTHQDAMYDYLTFFSKKHPEFLEIPYIERPRIAHLANLVDYYLIILKKFNGVKFETQ